MLAVATSVKLLAEIALLALASRGHVAARLQFTQEAVACLRQLTVVRPGQARLGCGLVQPRVCTAAGGAP